MIDERVSEILESLPSRPWSGVVYRVMLGDYPPDRENMVGARWNLQGIPAIYVSESEDTAIAEVNYRLSLQARPVKRDLRRTLYTIELRVGALIDLNEVLEQLAAIGLGKQHLLGGDMQLSQTIGKTATWLDRDALRVPSARGSACNIVVYPNWAKEGIYRFEPTSSRPIP